MASYRVYADLMAYTGAQYINAKARPRKEGESDADYAKVPIVSGVFIPDKYNDIQVAADTSKEGFRNASGLTAKLNLNVYPLRLGNGQDGQPTPHQKLVDAAKIRVQQQGNDVTAYNIPSVSVNASFRKEFLDDMRKKVAAQLIRQHPEWQGTTEETNTDLRRAVSARIPYEIGLGYLREPKGNGQSQQQAVAPAAFADFGAPNPFAPTGAVAAAGAQQQAPQMAGPGEAGPEDYLPF